MFESPKYIDKYNQNKYNVWFLVSFSLLSILFHLFPISRELHNTLYSANVFSLIGFTIIATFYPYRLYNYYGETFRNVFDQIGLSRVVHFNIYLLLFVAFIIHVIPVYVFRNKYSLGNPIYWLLLYFVFAGPFLGKIYNLTFFELTGVFLSTVVLFIAFSYSFRESIRDGSLFI